MIISFRAKVLVSFFAFELMGFGVWYLVSDGGLRSALALSQECVVVESAEKATQQEIEHICRDLKKWQEEPFFVEQYAREKLAMSRKGDQIFFVNENE